MSDKQTTLESPMQRPIGEDIVLKCINESQNLLNQAQSRIGVLINNPKIDADHLNWLTTLYERLNQGHNQLLDDYKLNKQKSQNPAP